MASISACVHEALSNRLGSSLLSKYMPFGASTLPKEWPVCPPIVPYGCDEVCAGGLLVGADWDDDWDDDDG